MITYSKNNYLSLFSRETNESNLLLKEKADSLQGKLQRAEQRITELTRVEIENEVCPLAYRVHDIQYFKNWGIWLGTAVKYKALTAWLFKKNSVRVDIVKKNLQKPQKIQMVKIKVKIVLDWQQNSYN